jgi:hypothetical protein
MPLSYYYFKDRIPNSSPLASLTHLTPMVNPLQDARNPVYNFTQDFIEKFQQVTPARLAKAVPYISMCTLDSEGNVVTDFNVKFFIKPIDMDKVNSQARYSDRPEVSLQSIAISQDLAAGGGTLGWTTVTMQFRVHKPDYITNNSLVSLLFSGLPMRIVYGWSSTDPHDDFLGVNDVLLFNVKDYSLNFDVAGQALLTVNGLTHGDNFANVYVGDDAEEITPDDVALAAADTPVTNQQQDNLFQQKAKIGQYVSYVSALNRSGSEGQRDVRVMDVMTQAYYDASDRASKKTRRQFALAMKRLAAKKVSKPQYFKDVKQKNKDGTISYAECVTLHDIVSILCGETIESLQGTVIPGNRDYRVVYGCFNENTGSDWAGKCLAEFPIHWRSFTALFSDQSEMKPLPSLQWIFAKLIDNFLSDSDYWRSNLGKQEKSSTKSGRTVAQVPESMTLPSVSFNVSSHFATAAGEPREIIQISFFDVNRNIPITQLKLRNVTIPMTEAQQINACIGDPPTIPVIRFGNANSLIKNVVMESFTDPAFKAFLMNRPGGAVASVRQSSIDGTSAPPSTEPTPFIPFKGSMDVLGHIDWKPARFFYLASGIFFIDGVYKILRVNHQLDASGFKTHLEFTRH